MIKGLVLSNVYDFITSEIRETHGIKDEYVLFFDKHSIIFNTLTEVILFSNILEKMEKCVGGNYGEVLGTFLDNVYTDILSLQEHKASVFLFLHTIFLSIHDAIHKVYMQNEIGENIINLEVYSRFLMLFYKHVAKYGKHYEFPFGLETMFSVKAYSLLFRELWVSNLDVQYFTDKEITTEFIEQMKEGTYYDYHC